MKLLMFRNPANAADYDGRPRLGALRPGHEDEVVDLSEVARDVIAVIDGGEPALSQAHKVAVDAKRGLSLKDVTLLPPIDAPRGNIIAMGRNYQKHAEETATDGDVKPPTIFTKAITSITGPYDDIRIDPAISDKLDWEVELGVVIGRTARFVSKEAALDHVWGYTIINDASARDFQFLTTQWMAGKIFETAAPVGPYIADRQEISDPHSLELRTFVNGKQMQRGNTKTFIFDVRYLVSYLSGLMTLSPGDLIATGTPPGVGLGMKPSPVFMQPGDVCRVEIDKLGSLENPVKEA